MILLTKMTALIGTTIALALVAALTVWWEAGVWDAQDRLASYQGEVRGGPVKGKTFTVPW